MSRQRSMEAIRQAEYVTIGELVRLTDVRYSTLKFYTEEGMLPFEQAGENLTRRYKRAGRRKPDPPLQTGGQPGADRPHQSPADQRQKHPRDQGAAGGYGDLTQPKSIR